MGQIRIVKRNYSTPDSFETMDSNGQRVYITFEEFITVAMGKNDGLQSWEPIEITTGW